MTFVLLDVCLGHGQDFLELVDPLPGQVLKNLVGDFWGDVWIFPQQHLYPIFLGRIDVLDIEVLFPLYCEKPVFHTSISSYHGCLWCELILFVLLWVPSTLLLAFVTVSQRLCDGAKKRSPVFPKRKLVSNKKLCVWLCAQSVLGINSQTFGVHWYMF